MSSYEIPTERHLTIEQVALRAGISVRTVRQRVADGRFPGAALRFGGKRWWRESEVTVALVADNESPHAARDIAEDIA